MNHDALIERLSREAAPVKRPAPSWQRTLAWVLMAVPAGFLSTWVLQRGAADWSAPGAMWAALNTASSFALGVVAVASAFSQSIAGGPSAGWKWFAPLLLVWGVSTLGALAVSSAPMGRPGDGTHCYTFMITAGLPMIALLLVFLRRSRAVNPRRCLAVAGLGITAMTLALLGLCHPVSAHALDLLLHLAGGLTLVGATVLAGRRWVSVF